MAPAARFETPTLDLGLLRCFVVVSEELHFGRAAMRLGLSQPQVSRRVRALEDELESGSHEQLIAAGGTYAELFELQARAYR